MAETKYGKYIVTGIRPDLKLPSFRHETKEIADRKTGLIYLDEEVIEGAFYVECVWYWKGTETPEVGAHTHPFDEVITFFSD